MAYQDITAKTYDLFDNVAGDDWRILIPVYQSDRTTEWIFTGWQAFAQVRKKSKLGTEIISFDTYDGTIQFVGGKMYLIADKDVTRQLTGGVHVWDCQFLEPTRGLRRTLIIESIFEIINDVAR